MARILEIDEGTPGIEEYWFEGLLLVGVYLLFALAYYSESPV
jgi:hypothetical protein